MENEMKKEHPKYMNVSIYVLLVVLIIVFFGGQAIMEQILSDIGQNALWIYTTILILIGFILNSIAFEVGKIIFGNIANFDLIYTNIFGLTWSKNKENKTVFSLRAWENYGSSTVMVPRSEDLNKCNPGLYVMGGLISTLILDAIFVIVGFIVKIPGFEKTCVCTGLGILLVGVIIIILNLAPFFQDGSLDMFYLRLMNQIEGAEKIFFNNLFQMDALYTGRRELSCYEYDDYHNTLAVKSLFYNYYYYMDHNDEVAARACIEKIIEHKDYILEDDLLKAYTFLYYFKLKNENLQDVSDEYLELDKSISKACSDSNSLENLKTAILVAALIEVNYDLYEYLVNKIDAVAAKYPLVSRTEKEVQKIEETLKIVEQRKADWFKQEDNEIVY